LKKELKSEVVPLKRTWL